MKKTSVNIIYDEEKLSALEMYIKQKNVTVEQELEKALETLYMKNVPSNVRNYIEMKLTNTPNAEIKVPKHRGKLTPTPNQDNPTIDKEA